MSANQTWQDLEAAGNKDLFETLATAQQDETNVVFASDLAPALDVLSADVWDAVERARKISHEIDSAICPIKWPSGIEDYVITTREAFFAVITQTGPMNDDIAAAMKQIITLALAGLSQKQVAS